MTSPYLTAAFLILIGTACWTDLRWRRIPNALVVAGLFSAFGLYALTCTGALVSSLQGAGLAFFAALPLFALGGLGGGDTKLLAAVGAFLGLELLPEALVLVTLVGAMMGLVEALRRGALPQLVSDTAGLGLYCVTMGRRGTRRTLQSPGAVGIPYGVAISLGALGAWYLGSFGTTAGIICS